MRSGFIRSSGQRARARIGLCVGALLTTPMAIPAADPGGEAQAALLIDGIDGAGPAIGDAATPYQRLRECLADAAGLPDPPVFRHCPFANARAGPSSADRMK